ncbi:MAG: phosphohydrolase [Actinobacteria bacterium HGW-Actinobacteria-7]|nr:MAG: phosphohydrolase [Actinobacteria bacterium HGW-Actinobacteria-7]
MGAPRYQAAFEALQARLSTGAVEHCQRVSQTAAELAQTYGAPVESARLAGLLHDWDRETGHEQLRSVACEAGIELTATDEAVPYLLHARTGALRVAETFPDLGADVLHAIASHTVGAGQMSALDRVVYIADMIEPGRDFPGLDELREAVGVITLDELYASCYQRSLLHLIERRRPLHPRTVDAWNALVSGGRDD